MLIYIKIEEYEIQIDSSGLIIANLFNQLH